MGFKCPICADDFGRDKLLWKDHIHTAHLGIGKEIVEMILKPFIEEETTMSLKSVHEKIMTIKNTPGTNDKVELLRTYLLDNVFKEAVILMYDDFFHFNISKLKNKVTPGPSLIKKSGTAQEIFDFLRKLASQKGATNKDKDHLADLCSSDDETYEVVYKIVNKDAKSGFSGKLINKAVPGTIYLIPYMRCSGEQEMGRIVYPAIAQEKADGMFVNIVLTKHFMPFISRNGNKIAQMDHLRRLLREKIPRRYGNIVIMGELLVFKNGKILPRKIGNGIINSCISGTCDPEEAKNVVIRIWDVVSYQHWRRENSPIPYKRRLQICKNLVGLVADRQKFDIIDTKEVKSISEAKDFYRSMRSLGKEGAIIKNYSGIWSFTTSKDSIKMKNVSDCELRIKMPEKGKGERNKHTLGALLCESEDGKIVVSVGTGITDIDRGKGWDYWLEQIGQIVTVEFESIISDKRNNDQYSLYLPRFPKESPFIEIRTDRTYADTYEEVKARAKKSNKK